MFSLDPFVIPCTSLHLLEEGHNHTIVRFAYLCQVKGEELVFFSFLYIKLLSLVWMSLSTTDPRLPTAQLICLNTHSGAAALSALMMLLCCLFAFASFNSRHPSTLSAPFRTTKQGRWNRGNERKINRRTRISRKSIEALASFQVSMHCNLSKQKWSGQCHWVAG